MWLLYGTFFKGRVEVLWNLAVEEILCNIWVERNSRILQVFRRSGEGFWCAKSSWIGHSP